MDITQDDIITNTDNYLLAEQFEPYGNVPPSDSRLLKILPNGFPIYEPPGCIQSYEEESEKLKESSHPINTHGDELHLMNSTLLQAEKRMKHMTGSLDALRHLMEKFFIVMDHDIRQAEMKRDPILRHQAEWINCEQHKFDALKELAYLKDLLRLSGSIIQPDISETIQSACQISFQPSVKLISPENQWKYLALTLVRRINLCLPLLKMADRALVSCRTSETSQQLFLRVVHTIRKFWKIQKVPYATHVFEKGDDYPYRAELRIDLINIPWDCWGYDRPKRWNLDDYLNTHSSDIPIGQCISPPFLCWPPLPAAYPTTPATAEVFFTVPKQQTLTQQNEFVQKTIISQNSSNDHITDSSLGHADHTLGIQIRWIGDACHCIESNRELQVRIIPVAIRSLEQHHYPAKNDHMTSLSNAYFTEKNKSLNEFHTHFPSLLPEPYGIETHWEPESISLHRRLQTAQWRLVDRAIHLIYQAQAARLKNLFDIVSYGSTDNSHYAGLILQEYEQFNQILNITLPQSSSKDITPLSHINQQPLLPDTCPDEQFKYIRIPRNVTVDRWETYMTSISFHNLPIYSSTIHDTAINKKSIQQPRFFIQLEIWVNYTSSDTAESVNLFNQETYKRDDQAYCIWEDPLIQEFLKKIPVVEALAVCYLRNQFLQAWKSTIRDLPRECYDLHSLTLPSTREQRGAQLFTQFIDWIQIYLTTRML